jgi:hypothetical protein
VNEERGPRVERLLAQAARRVLGHELHPLELLQRVQAAVEDGVSRGRVPNLVEIAFHPADYARFEPQLEALRGEVERLLERIQRTSGAARIGAWSVHFASASELPEGAPEVAARFADTAHARPPSARADTRRLLRHAGVDLVVDGTSRVPLTHTPFSIGRGPENDLPILSLSVSRYHAEIDVQDGAFVLRDLGSRNRIVADGQRIGAVVLGPGVVARIGDVELRLERRP